MKLLAVLMALLVLGCLQRSSRTKTTKEVAHPLAELYTGAILHNLQNWPNTEEVTDTEVTATKKAIMGALRKIGFNTLPDLESDKLLVSYNKEHAVINISSKNELCSDDDRSSCFHLQVVPSGHDVYEVTIIKLPAYDDLGAIADSWSDENIEELLTTLLEVFPHDIEKDQLQVDSHGKDASLTLVLLTDETPKRELHIEAHDGTIDNSRNTQHRYRVYQDEMRQQGNTEGNTEDNAEDNAEGNTED